MNSKEVLIIETVKGEISIEKLLEFSVCLMHERLTPTVYPTSCEKPLTLQHIEYHRDNLLSLENTALTPGMIDHELQNLLHNINRQTSQAILLDSSGYQTRVPELLEKYMIVKGYQYRLSGNPSQSQRTVLLSKDHIYKQLEYEFKLGNGKYKPGFIGQLLLKECLEQDSYFNAFKAYLEYSSKTNCLIIINSLELGRKIVHNYLKNHNSPSKTQQTISSMELLRKIETVLNTSKEANAKRVIIYNLPFIFETKFDENNFTQTTQNILHSGIIELFKRYECYFGFDLSRYSQSSNALRYIGQLISKYPNRIILSAGLSYKTDLTVNGGHGYLYHKGNNLSEMVQIAGEKNILSALSTKKLELLSWKIKIQQIKIVILWKCSQCGSQNPETLESFRKFGKQFCSIKCLKSHKF